MKIFTKETPPFGYYVYAYLRNKDSKTAKAGTPYYIGKGSNTRAWDKHLYHNVPSDTFILIISENLTELWAFALERRLIRWYGRKNNGTGILNNLTDGGEGSSGAIRSNETRKLLSDQKIGRKRGPLSDTIKSKISLKNKGVKKSASHVEKMKLHRHSAETRQKISEKGRARGPVSEETGAKISAALKGKRHSEETKIKMKIKAKEREERKRYSASTGTDHDSLT